MLRSCQGCVWAGHLLLLLPCIAREIERVYVHAYEPSKHLLVVAPKDVAPEEGDETHGLAAHTHTHTQTNTHKHAHTRT
jgi:hypothetical protein